MNEGRRTAEQDRWAEVQFLTVFFTLMQSGQKGSRTQGQKLLRLMADKFVGKPMVSNFLWQVFLLSFLHTLFFPYSR